MRRRIVEWLAGPSPRLGAEDEGRERVVVRFATIGWLAYGAVCLVVAVLTAEPWWFLAGGAFLVVGLAGILLLPPRPRLAPVFVAGLVVVIGALAVADPHEMFRTAGLHTAFLYGALVLATATLLLPGGRRLFAGLAAYLLVAFLLSVSRHTGPRDVVLLFLAFSPGAGTGILVMLALSRHRASVEEGLLTALAASPVPLVIADREARIVVFSREAEALLGYTAAEVIGEPIDRLVPRHIDRNHDALAHDFIASPQRTLRVGEDFAVEAVRKDGTRVPVLVSLAKLETRERSYVAAALFDLTKRRDLEEALRRRADALADLNTRLEEFTSAAAHDLQSPLRKVRAFAERLGATETGLSERGRDYLARIERAVAREQTLITDLLAYTRAGRAEQELVPVDLGEVVAEAARRVLPPEYREEGFLEVGELPTVRGDRSQLLQVFSNLLENAHKYRAEDRPPRIVVAATTCGDRHVVTVTDTGRGFDPAHAERIFEALERLDPETSGTGLGLALCRRILTAHGGTITATGSPGEGATFTVTLPAGPGPGPPPGSSPEADGDQTRST